MERPERSRGVPLHSRGPGARRRGCAKWVSAGARRRLGRLLRAVAVSSQALGSSWSAPHHLCRVAAARLGRSGGASALCRRVQARATTPTGDKSARLGPTRASARAIRRTCVSIVRARAARALKTPRHRTRRSSLEASGSVAPPQATARQPTLLLATCARSAQKVSQMRGKRDKMLSSHSVTVDGAQRNAGNLSTTTGGKPYLCETCPSPVCQKPIKAH
eukprot:4312095-Prymnesium_polylepis.2